MSMLKKIAPTVLYRESNYDYDIKKVAIWLQGKASPESTLPKTNSMKSL